MAARRADYLVIVGTNAVVRIRVGPKHLPARRDEEYAGDGKLAMTFAGSFLEIDAILRITGTRLVIELKGDPKGACGFESAV